MRTRAKSNLQRTKKYGELNGNKKKPSSCLLTTDLACLFLASVVSSFASKQRYITTAKGYFTWFFL